MSTAFIPARYFRVLLNLLQEHGLNPAEPLALIGLSPAFITSQQDDFLTLEQVETLVNWSLQATGIPSLGVHLGKRLNLSAHRTIFKA